MLDDEKGISTRLAVAAPIGGTARGSRLKKGSNKAHRESHGITSSKVGQGLFSSAGFDHEVKLLEKQPSEPPLCNLSRLKMQYESQAPQRETDSRW